MCILHVQVRKLRKLLLSISIVLVIAVALAGSARADTTTIAVYPAQLEVDVGESYVINITVTDVDDLFLCMFRLKWNNSVLQLNSIVEGPFIKQGGSTAFMTDPLSIDDINADGKINEATCTLLGPMPGVSGNGTIATLNFTALAVGTTAIEFWEDPPAFEEKTVLVDSLGELITHDRVDGNIDVIPEFPVSMFVALFLLMTLLVVAFQKMLWSKGHTAVDVE